MRRRARPTRAWRAPSASSASPAWKIAARQRCGARRPRLGVRLASRRFDARRRSRCRVARGSRQPRRRSTRPPRRAAARRSTLLSGRYAAGRRRTETRCRRRCERPPSRCASCAHSLSRGGNSRSRSRWWTTVGMTGAWSPRRSAHARLELRLGACVLVDPNDLGIRTRHGLHGRRLREARSSRRSGQAGSPPTAAPLHELRCATPFWRLRAASARPRGSARRRCCRFLMNQARTAGIGNYVLSEALHRARVHPFAECGALDDARPTARCHEATTRRFSARTAAGARAASGGRAR